MEFRIEELPVEAQQRLTETNESLRAIHRVLAQDHPDLAAWSETMCLLVFKLTARAEHAEWRLAMLEEDLASQ